MSSTITDLRKGASFTDRCCEGMFCDLCRATEGEIKRIPFTWIRACPECLYLYSATKEVDDYVRYGRVSSIDTDNLGTFTSDPRDRYYWGEDGHLHRGRG